MKKILVLAFLFFSINLNASLTIDPYGVEIKTDRNSSFSSKWKVKNNYAREIKLNISSLEWDSYKANKNIPVNSWLKIVPDEITLGQGESKEIFYTADAGGQMQGSVLAKVTFTVPPERDGGVIVKMSFPVHMIIKGTEKVEFNVENLSISSVGKSAKLNVTVKNTGNILIKPYGTADIYKKKKVAASVFIESDHSVFTDSQDSYSVNLPDNLKPGKYTAQVSIKALGYESYAPDSKKAIQFRVKKDGSIISQ
ncbi:MAG: hypothetical protein LBQ47_06055 [Endomicrobium sp.]|jgi:hypothetical protein|nr:hypothetical protein [Endomicrobium sp.]